MNIDVTQWEQLEKERELTMSDPKFQRWMSELNVSQSYEDPTFKLNARDVQSQYDVKKYQKFFS